MKVMIADQDAMAALPWEALKAYLDASDWLRVDDVTGKAAAYQYTDRTGRPWEILVPLRRDLGDYVSRMADAVTILARIEDRSELEVYEAIRRLGVEAAPADDATRAVHEQIRRWLAEEGWHIRDVDDPQSRFNVMVTLDGADAVNIYQYRRHVDHLTIHRHVLLDDTARAYFARLPIQSQRDVGRQIFRDMSLMGLEVEDLQSHPLEMRYRSVIYFDGLTKQSLVQSILLVMRANTLSLRTIADALEDAGLAAELGDEPQQTTDGHRHYPPNVIEFPGLRHDQEGRLRLGAS